MTPVQILTYFVLLKSYSAFRLHSVRTEGCFHSERTEKPILSREQTCLCVCLHFKEKQKRVELRRSDSVKLDIISPALRDLERGRRERDKWRGWGVQEINQSGFMEALCDSALLTANNMRDGYVGL